MSERKMITLTLSLQQLAKIAEEKNKCGLSTSEIIRRAIDFYLECKVSGIRVVTHQIATDIPKLVEMEPKI